MYSILRLPLEVLGYIVNYDCSLEVTSEPREILDEDGAGLVRVLAVEAMLHASFRVQVVDDPVGIVLHGRCEYYKFVGGRHALQEFSGARANQEVPSPVLVLDQVRVCLWKGHRAEPRLVRSAR